MYMSTFGNVYVLIEKQLVPLSQPYTPGRVSMPMSFSELSDYAKLYEYLKPRGINLDVLVKIEPAWEVYNVLGPTYCPETMPSNDRAVCLLKNTPQIIYHLCVGKPAPRDADPAALITELLSNSNYVSCARNAINDAKFNVTVDLDMVVSYLNDIVQAVYNMAMQYYSKIDVHVAYYATAKMLFASRVITSLINKRVGDAYNTSPGEFIAELMRVYNTASGVVDSLSKAILARFAT